MRVFPFLQLGRSEPLQDGQFAHGSKHPGTRVVTNTDSPVTQYPVVNPPRDGGE